MIGDLLRGAGLLLRGIGIVFTRPRLIGLGVLPPLITTVLMIAALVGLGFSLDTILTALTGFTRDWGTAGEIVETILGLVVVGAAVLLMVLTFTAVTITIGDPIYQRISRRVDAELGPPPPAPVEKTGAMVWRMVRQLLMTLALSALAAIVCFALGFVPVVGTAVAAVAAALIGGRLIVREITGPPFERRGLLETSDRRPALNGNWPMVLGFGIPTFLLLSIPGATIIVFPAAVAGGTLLVRRLLNEPEAPAEAEGAR